MAERKHISLTYQYDDKWIGGTYYMLNIIRALNQLPDASKPFLTIYHNSGSSLNDLNQVAYSYIEYVEFSAELGLLKKALNKAYLKLFRTEFFYKKLPAAKVENYYFKTFVVDSSNIKNYYYWIADLQDLILPQFFQPADVKKRLENYNRLVKEKQPIVFSSQAALNDFNSFFPNNENEKKVLPFVSSAPLGFEDLSIADLKAKFNITKPFFIVSNQFWKHKNHLVVLKALNLFIKQNPNMQLLLTGKEYDHRNPQYTDDLKEYVKSNGLGSDILFLGFIARDEQLKLMSESMAIIQPSLFEGWSTVVEDAKFLNKTIICSDIAVHREQLPFSDLFFKPDSENELLEKMEHVAQTGYRYQSTYNAHDAMISFAQMFLKLFD